MSIRRIIYAVLAFAGFAIPTYFTWQFSQTHPGGFSPSAFLAGGFANHAATAFSSDLFVVSLAGMVWMFFEAKRLNMRFIWAYLLLSFVIAFSFTFPLFLFVREGALEKEPGGYKAGKTS